jgi:hypothetical protein
MNRNEGFSNVSFFPVHGFGRPGPRRGVRLLPVQNRIDRDTRPLFFPAPPEGRRSLYDYPFANTGFSKGVGDLRIGGKFNLMSQEHGKPAGHRGALASSSADGQHDDGVAPARWTCRWTAS